MKILPVLSIPMTTCLKEVLPINNLWKRLGNPKFFCAPMVSQSELAFRLLVRNNGCDVAFSQMINAKAFWGLRNQVIDWEAYKHVQGLKDEEDAARELDSNIIVQLAGDNPIHLLEAGRYLEHRVAALDLNLGCPQQIAKKGNYGAYLLSDPTTIVTVLTAMVKGLSCPITAKIRVLSSDEETIELCKRIEACGVQMLTVHGRTVSSNKQFTGPANWDIIAKIKSTLSIPIVANGGVECREDALRCLAYTQADAVMSSEGLLENPKLFSEEGDLQYRTNYISSQLTTIAEYESLFLGFPQVNVNVSTGTRVGYDATAPIARAHVFKMLHRLINAPANFDLRLLLARGNLAAIFDVCHQLQARAELLGYSCDVAMEKGFLLPENWYSRHRQRATPQKEASPPN